MCTVAPVSFEVTSSIVGRIKVSRFTSGLSFLQMRTFPDFFMTGTIGAHHDVDCMMSTIIPAAAAAAWRRSKPSVGVVSAHA